MPPPSAIIKESSMLEKYLLKMPGNVFSGKNALDNLEAVLKKNGPSLVALLTDKGIGAAGLPSLVADRIAEAGFRFVLIDDIPAEPDYHVADRLYARIAGCGADFIVALGGGSVMDMAKLAGLLDGECSTADLLVAPARAEKHIRTLLIPTTCGTGSEATCNSIVFVPEQNMKVGIVNDGLIPDYVILDPEMIRSLPSKIVASTGLDALCHAIECFTGTKANPFSDLFALKALELIFSSIEKAVDGNGDDECRQRMQIAAFYAGVAISSSGTTAVHALSYPLGGRYHIAHGVSNAMLLVPVMRFNAEACQDRLEIIHDVLFGRSDIPRKEKAGLVLERLEQMVKALDIPGLSSFGITEEDLPSLAKDGLDVKRLMMNNPRPMCLEEAVGIYREAL